MYAMAKKKKPLCKWDKDDIKDNLDELKELVAPARYICRKCGRAAKDDSHVCKPDKI
jgi:hypothetical protein